MAIFSIADNQRNFLLDGEPCFFLADTAWAAFTNISDVDWERYVYYRFKQGFNALQINILPQHDRTGSRLDIHPFEVNDDGTYNYDSMNETYFDRIVNMLGLMQDVGMVPVLVLLWSNYVQGTWSSDMGLGGGAMALAQAKTYARYVVEKFAPFTPTYFVSGDTDFSDVSSPYYQMGLEVVKELSPQSLTALHITPTTTLPDSFIESPLLDFYVYQSGHHPDNQALAYRLAKEFYDKPITRPVVNSEPNYEQMGVQYHYGRWQRQDVRRIMWQSVLSGSTAGMTYGAHGIWNWRDTMVLINEIDTKGFHDLPLQWIDAMHLRGAWDYSYAKHYFEVNNLYNLIPMSESLEYLNTIGLSGGEDHESERIRIAMTDDEATVFVYIPHNTLLRVEADWSAYDFKILDLFNNSWGEIAHIYEDGYTHFELHSFEQDVLLVGKIE